MIERWRIDKTHTTSHILILRHLEEKGNCGIGVLQDDDETWQCGHCGAAAPKSIADLALLARVNPWRPLLVRDSITGY